MSLPTVAIIGRPNVGKSRLFNRISGKKQAIVSDISGTTRDRVMCRVDDQPIPFLLIDTGGLEFDEQTGVIEDNMQIQARIAANEADIILFITESKVEPLPQDYQVTELLRKSGNADKPIIFGLSKCDDKISESVLAGFYSLGLDEPIQISAIHKKGIDELLGQIQKDLKTLGYSKKDGIVEETEIKTPRVSLIGRPNVGKSSLVNAFLSEERLIVSDIPGTTRDSVDTEIRWEGQDFIFTDTAGLRKRGKVEKGIEKWSTIRTLQNLSDSDVALLLIDGEEGICAQDQHVAEMAVESGVSLILMVNKWDTQEKGEEARDEFLWKLKKRFPFLSWAPILFVSAKNKRNIVKVFPSILEVIIERNKRVTTGKLNTFVAEIVRVHAPTGTKKINPKIFYMSQVETAPPKFKIFVNKKEYFHFSFFRYLENALRDVFGFWGTPIQFDVVDRDSIYQKKKQGK